MISRMEPKIEPGNVKKEKTRNNNGKRIARTSSTNKVFLGTLWKIVEDPECDGVIHWDPEDPCAFRIEDLEQFKSVTLPNYYNAKWHSFRRQLYFYGFKATRDVLWKHLCLDHRDESTFSKIQRVKTPSTKRKFDDLYANFGMFSAMFNPMMQQSPFQYSPPGMLNPDQMGKVPNSLANFLPPKQGVSPPTMNGSSPQNMMISPQNMMISPQNMMMPMLPPMMPVMSPVYMSSHNHLMNQPQVKRMKPTTTTTSEEAQEDANNGGDSSNFLKSKSNENEEIMEHENIKREA